MLLIDPMHNLYLGTTAKHVLQAIWIGRDMLSSSDLDVIYQQLKRVKLNAHIGRLRAILDSGTTFTLHS